MKIIVKMLVCVLAIAALSGCAADQMKPFLDNLSHDCTRHYTGSVGGTLGTATVAFDINCAPETVKAPTTP